MIRANSSTTGLNDVAASLRPTASHAAIEDHTVYIYIHVLLCMKQHNRLQNIIYYDKKQKY